jgi:hypothetical protein
LVKYLENAILRIQLDYYYPMTTKTAAAVTTALILATFALISTGVAVLPAAFAQDGDQDSARDVDPETDNVQVADASPKQNEDNRQGNLISQVQDLLSTQGMGGGIGGSAGVGAGPGATADSSQGQGADDASQGNAGYFGDDLGIGTAFNVGQVNVDLRDLVDLTTSSSPPAEG